MNIHVIICSALTFAFMTALGMGLQWLNAEYSVFGTAPIFALVIIMALLIRRWEKKNGSLLRPGRPDRPSRRSPPEQ